MKHVERVAETVRDPRGGVERDPERKRPEGPRTKSQPANFLLTDAVLKFKRQVKENQERASACNKGNNHVQPEQL